MSHYLSLLVFLPLAGALAVLLTPGQRPFVTRCLANAAATAALAASIPLWVLVR